MTEPKNIITVPFLEHPITDYRNTEPDDFDISALGTEFEPDFVSDKKFNMQQYCFCILNKLKALNNSRFEDFLNYQCKLVKDPMCWINKFEKLIAENLDCCDSKKWKASAMKINNLIELKRASLKRKTNDKLKVDENQNNNSYNFKKLKNDISSLIIEEQIVRLHEAKAEYLQNLPTYFSMHETPFDKAINIELEKINMIAPFQKPSLKKKPATKEISQQSTIQINGNLNVFVDVFYQLLNLKLKDGKPFLKEKSAEVLEFICTHILDKDGNPASPESVRTILSPNKIDKRPKGDKGIQLKSFEDFDSDQTE